MRKFIPFFLLILLATACQFTPTEVVPTVAVLPTLTESLVPSQTPVTPTVLPTDTPIPSPTPQPTLTPTPAPTDTAVPPTLTPTPPPTETPLPPTLTDTPAGTPTLTLTLTPEFSYTPSLTITNTITPTLTPSLTPSPEVTGMAAIVLLSENITILPPELRYNPQTLTAVHYAAETLIAIGTATPPGTPAAPTNDPNVLATLPPPPGGGSVTTCIGIPPVGLGAVLATYPELNQRLGCPLGSFGPTSTASQDYEHGMMIYEQSTGSIYVLTFSDFRFRRFPDTWVEGVDPDAGGETPPAGLIEPRRGFGKIWRSNPDVRAALGWAITDEQGASATLQVFEYGRALYLPQHGHTVVLMDDPGGASGTWEELEVSF
jgi:hypothetical protein